MSWESTAVYYEIINKEINKRLGGVHTGKIVLYSFDFEIIEKLQHEGKWAELTDKLINAAQKLEKAGAEVILI